MRKIMKDIFIIVFELRLTLYAPNLRNFSCIIVRCVVVEIILFKICKVVLAALFRLYGSSLPA